jgi:hypothetical protein
MTIADDRDIRIALTNASLDAPRVDLWERLEAPVAALTRRRRPPFRVLRALAAALALMLASGALLAVFSLAGDAPEQRGQQLNAVPDLVLTQSWDERSQANVLQGFLPRSRQLVTVLDGVNVSAEPVVSRDGRQLVYTGWEDIGDTRTVIVWALDSETLGVEWRVDIAAESIASLQNGPAMSTSVAVTGERVIVAHHRWETAEPVVIDQFARANGRKLGSTPVDFGGLLAGNVKLFAAPDDSEAVLLTDVWDVLHPSAEQVRTASVTFSLPDMREVTRILPEHPTPSDERFYTWDGRMTPDGRALYQLAGYGQGDTMAVVFFDLATGNVERVDLGFDSYTSFIYQHGVSHDGRQLYVLDPSSGELAIVDLQRRALQQSLLIDMSRVQASGGSWLGRVWGAVRGLVVQEASAKVYISGTLQLAPDGSRMYAVGVRGGAIEGEPRGVLVINTRTWQVDAHWLPDANPTQVLLGGDGRYLYVPTVDWGGSGDSALRVLDTASGAEVFATEGTGYGVSYSPAELYRATYGVSPAIRGVDVADLRRGSLAGDEPFATLSVSVSAAALVSGDPVTIEARYLDPADGNLVVEGEEGVRFDEPDHIRAVLSTGGSAEEDVTVVLGRAGYGTYRGATVLPRAGAWTVKVIAEREDEPSRYALVEDAVTIQPAIFGDDGRRYILSVSIDPAAPAPNQEVTARVAVVDAETGAPLPDGVFFQGGMPEHIDASFFLQEAGVTSRDLFPVRHGVYEGKVSFFSSGTWSVSANFPQDGRRSGSIPAGTVVVE